VKSLFQIVTPPHACGYLPEEMASMEYEYAPEVSREEYLERLNQGWRRFGGMMFRPLCAACNQCRSLRVLVERFHPNRSQRRTIKLNQGEVQLRIGKPAATPAKLTLYDRFHGFQADAKAWPAHPGGDIDSYVDSFVDNPFPIEEWSYYLEERLIGVGYVDTLPGGLSAIYFFYDPDERRRGLGTWNVLNLINRAASLRIPYVYLGFYVAGCSSLAYKANFRPHERREPDGLWREPVER